MGSAARDPAERRNLAALTGLRGIAAWAVVLYHMRLTLTDILPAASIVAFGKGYLAVDLFFVLSGFVIWLNYAEPVGTGGLATTRRFLWRRIARIWPLHAVILGTFVIPALLLHVTGRNAEHFPFAELPLHLLLIQNWGFTSALTWNDAAWSISTEFAAYLSFPVVAVAAARLPRLTAPALLALAVALCIALCGLFAWQGQATLGQDITGLGLWRCLAEFALGCVASALWQRGVGTAGGWAGCALGWVAGGLTMGWPETAIVPFAAFSLVLALASARATVQRLLGTGWIHRLGEISYSTYLSHMLLFTLFKFAFVGDELQVGWAGLIGYLAFVLAASIVLHDWVERPAQDLLNRWAERPRRARAQPAA